MEAVCSAGAVDGEQFFEPCFCVGNGFFEFGVLSGQFGLFGRREVVSNGIRQNEITVGQTLHQRACAEAVGAMVREVGLTDDMQTWEVGHEVIVHPEAAHGIVDGGIDAHGHGIRVFPGDGGIHVKQVAIALGDDFFAEAGNGVCEVEIDAASGRANAAALVAHLFGCTRGNVARAEVAIAGVFALQIIVSVSFWNACRVFAQVFFLFGHPYTPIIPQAFRHECQFGLVVPGDGDAGGVDLGIAGVGEGGALAIGADIGRNVAAFGICRQIEDVAITACGQDDSVSRPGFHASVGQVSRHNAACMAVDNHQLQHFVAGIHFDVAGVNLACQGLIGADEQLLSCLAARIESARDLCAAEGAVGQEPAIFAGKGDALCRALVDDAGGHLCQAMDVGFACAKVASLNGVIEEAVDAVAVVLVVFGCVDAALGCDGVCAPGAVLEAEGVHLIAELA